MKSKQTRTLLIYLIIAIFIILVTSLFRALVHKKSAEQQYSDLKNIQQIQTYNKGLDHRPIMIIFFHPDCDICLSELSQIKQYSEQFRSLSIFMITTATEIEISSFIHDQTIDPSLNLQFISDTDGELEQLFNIKMIPSIFLYNKNGKLIHKTKGGVFLPSLLQYYTTLHEK